ncbi:MAG: hydrolase TatD [Gammaproteobacteria bacterium]|nr:MAG: hydrolase TatD [Gammaproteobacteria bacterium]
MTGPLTDIGANLTHDAFDADREAVIERARANGVRTMIVTGASETGSLQALELARSWPGTLYATAGVHPHHAKDVTPDTLSVLGECAEAPETLAVGETGLDFFRDFSPRDVQERVFAEQLELGAQSQLPVFMHLRDAHERFLAIVKEHRDAMLRGVVHCFTGTREELWDFLDLDLHIGITGWICDERRGHHLREFIGDIPDNRLMIETDAPYLLPRDLPGDFDPQPSGRRNEPAILPHVLAAVADATGKPDEEVAAKTTATAREFFSIPD